MRKITNEELNRLTPDEFAAAEKLPVEIVLDNIRSLNNVGSFFRTADAFTCARVHLCGITATPPNREIHKTALGAELTVEWRQWPSTVECVKALKEEGVRVLAIEQVEGAEMAGEWRAERGVRYGLVFGNEVLASIRLRLICATVQSRSPRQAPNIRSTWLFRAV